LSYVARLKYLQSGVEIATSRRNTRSGLGPHPTATPLGDPDAAHVIL
jgi:hypothetical protein